MAGPVPDPPPSLAGVGADQVRSRDVVDIVVAGPGAAGDQCVNGVLERVGQ